MFSKRRLTAGVACFSLLGIWLMAAEVDSGTMRQRAAKAEKEGNFKNALTDYQKLALDPKDEPALVSDDLTHAIQCLRQLNRVDEIDDFREKVIETHKANWRLLQTAAATFLQGDSQGYIVAGKFYRGYRRGEGRYVYTLPRDRQRALQLFVQALPLAQDDVDKSAVAEFFNQFAQAWLHGANGDQAWRLQILTDLKELPDYDDTRWSSSGTSGAAVDADGNPVFHQLPATFAAAKSDGERWRWALSQVVAFAPDRKPEISLQFADFLRQQFDVQTMAQYNWFFRGREDDQKQTPTYALDTLGEAETLAKLATGIKRFPLPEEFNFIKIYQAISLESENDWGRQALQRLANLFTDRRQYSQAAEYWKKSIAKYGSNRGEQEALDQIVKNWGRFDHATVFPAGTGPQLEYVFRNGKRVEFEAWEIKVPQLLEDVKAYIKASPNQLDWNKANIQNIGQRLVFERDLKYVGDRVAQWGLDLTPRANHFDRRVTVTTPLQKAGAYLVTAQLADGNISRIIVWVADTVIAKKQLDKQAWYYVADAVTGKPVPQANIEFFGWKQTQVGNTNKYQITTSNF
ncbi:MAG: alpha-2-macroglobulin, partial [Planctomycetota bacterium]